MARYLILALICAVACSCATTSSFYGERRLEPTDIGELVVLIDDRADNCILSGNEFLQKSIVDEVCATLQEKCINAIPASSVDVGSEAYTHMLVLQALGTSRSQGYYQSDRGGGGTTYTVNMVQAKAVILQKTAEGSFEKLCESYSYGDGMNLLEKRLNMSATGQLLGYEKNLDSVYRQMFVAAASDLFAKPVQKTSGKSKNRSAGNNRSLSPSSQHGFGNSWNNETTFMLPYREDAYGYGVHSDATGKPFQWKTRGGQKTYGPVKPNAYGLGVGMDRYGRPVKPEPWP
ncbi:MAG: hypothetical protein C4532_03285 [Candidatus Abyssobacteria bacterium SURF_17]|uniref:Uncharacterized protein n=1 Tax=Candidatus Abyssobacteria bacterium SURF_17 TaxID=2093361 RepID=A0A419F6C1_9BACT|nr:MAG: hypothetical protein C4532_03285 [Candidatus Abyssubacteria bacterium SURF_17]